MCSKIHISKEVRSIKRLVAGLMTLVLTTVNINMIFAESNEVIENTSDNQTQAIQEKKYMKVNTSSLNVRSDANASSIKLGSLPRGTKVEVIEQSGIWYKIVYKAGYGWCSGDYLVGDNSSSSDNSNSGSNIDNNNSNNNNNGGNTQVNKYMKVNTNSLNVRSGPSASSKKLGSISRGTKVQVTEKSGIWYKIAYKNSYGWCSGDYLVDDTSSNDNNNSNNNNNGGNTQTKKYMKVNTSSLNVRSGPSTSSKKLGSISKGAKVEVTEKSGIWYKIAYKNGYGWCSGDYLVDDTSSNDDNNSNNNNNGGNTQTKKYMKVNTNSLNVRSGPSTNSKKLGSISKGTRVEVLEKSGVWYKIVYLNGYGWCSGDYLVDENNNSNNGNNPNDNKLTKGHYIVIKTYNNTMAYYKDGKLISQHRVATGKRSTPTPKGKFKVVNKIVNRPYYTGNIPGGHPKNPLGKRWIGLQVGSTYGTTYAIHGNNNESSIGGYVSGGCIRMHNKEVEWLFNQVPIGTQVIISSSAHTFKEIAASYKVSVE